MANGYPPGVTGNEYAIAGPDHEEEDYSFCEPCGQDQEGMTYTFRGERWFRCGTCAAQTDLPDLEDDGPDPDREYDLRNEEGY